MLTKKDLRERKFNATDLEKAIITDLLSQGDAEEITTYMKDVVNYGCQNGIVTALIYYTDTEKFFKKHFNDIFDLYNQYIEETGTNPNFELNANNLAWFAYENICYNLLNEFGVEF
ncbi:TPA: hypothetical protein PTV74_003312 [Clostridium botulinum]|nr:hypothetical protein [Clostridium botulinum]HDK7206467.1 hypothetical protein [Clostridium botulinum]HDK7210202.1 hypothetical protein [Clostridium botulinum]HDK7265652.1 hypothetical protein [Clostridium botulinum]HDK7269499.1 hypothetical protein [Clostridium botulinum]